MAAMARAERGNAGFREIAARARVRVRIGWAIVAAWIVAVGAGSGAARAQDWVDQVFPNRNHNFGTVARYSKVRHAFPVVNSTDREVRIEDVRSKCGCTDIRLGAKVIPPGTRTVIEATLDTSKFEGYKASGLTLVLSAPTATEVDLNFTCFIRGDVLVEPGNFDFGAVGRGTEPSKTIQMSYRGRRSDWAVVKMETNRDGVVARLTETKRSPEGGVEYRLVATLSPDLPVGMYKDEVLLRTNDPETPTIPITVTAEVRASLAASPSILNLGPVAPGASVSRNVVVRGREPFKIVELRGPEGEFSVNADPERAKPVHALALKFTAPDRPGPYHAVVTFKTDDPETPEVPVSVFATIRE